MSRFRLILGDVDSRVVNAETGETLAVIEKGTPLRKAWDVAYPREVVDEGRQNREQITTLLAEDPTLSAAELGRRVGCSREAARHHKWHIQQGG